MTLTELRPTRRPRRLTLRSAVSGVRGVHSLEPVCRLMWEAAPSRRPGRPGACLLLSLWAPGSLWMVPFHGSQGVWNPVRGAGWGGRRGDGSGVRRLFHLQTTELRKRPEGL